MADKSKTKSNGGSKSDAKRALRSRQWFDNPDNPGMTALYLERYLNFGLTPGELRSGKPIIGIAQTGSDLSPCNRHHLELAKRVRDGITAAGGLAFEFPVHPIQETGKRPTAALDRNLAYLGLVEILMGYFIDGVVLTTGCDKTTPACIMAAATVNIPAIVLSGGPMLNGWHHGQRSGSGTVVWQARADLAEGKIDYEEFMEIVTSSAPSVGHCNTMGTASTMNSLAEALGMSLPGCAAIPAPHRERGQIAYRTGQRIVEMVWEDLKPSDILTREAFENTIVVNSAIGGSTNAPIHINAIARHIGVPLSIQDWETIGHKVPLLVNMQPAGKYLGEEYHRAGGVPAVVNELMKRKLIHEKALTVNGKTMGENCAKIHSDDHDVIMPIDKPLKEDAGFVVLSGNLFNDAIVWSAVAASPWKPLVNSKPSETALPSLPSDGAHSPAHTLKLDSSLVRLPRPSRPLGPASSTKACATPSIPEKCSDHLSALSSYIRESPFVLYEVAPNSPLAGAPLKLSCTSPFPTAWWKPVTPGGSIIHAFSANCFSNAAGSVATKLNSGSSITGYW